MENMKILEKIKRSNEKLKQLILDVALSEDVFTTTLYTDTMLEVIDDLSITQVSINNAKNDISLFEQQDKLLESQLMQEITSEYDKNGKLVYSNAEKRTAELSVRLSNSKTHTNEIKELQKYLFDLDVQVSENRRLRFVLSETIKIKELFN